MLLSCIFSRALIFHLGHFFLFVFCLHVPVMYKGWSLTYHQGGATHIAALWCYMWERGPRGNNATCSALCWLSVTSPVTHKRIGPFWCRFPWWVVLYMFQDPVGLSNELSCEAGSSPAASTPTGVFNQRLEALFPGAGILGCLVCVTPQLFLPVYLHTNVGLSVPLAATSPQVLSTQLPISAPPTGLDECFFFNSLVLGLPFSLIFCQSWLVFVFKFVVVLLLVVHGGKVCLPMPPSWPEVSFECFDAPFLSPSTCFPDELTFLSL